MTTVELINNVVMVLLIGFMVIVFASVVIKTLGEERRKNYELSDKLLDKAFDRFEKMITKMANNVISEVKKDKQPNITSYSNFVPRINRDKSEK